MENNQREKTIEIDGRRFLLQKLDARTGSYIAFKLMKLLSPALSKISNGEDNNIEEIAKGIFSLSKEEFEYIQDSCLKRCYEILPARNTQVLNDYGVYGNDDIEFNAGLIMNLTIQSLVFNISGFFTEGLLNSIKEKLAFK